MSRAVGQDTDYELAVIGAGPAGTSAALAAAEGGLRVVLIDENPSAGGQVWRAPVHGRSTGPDARAGDELRARLAASTVECLFNCRLWLVEPGFSLHVIGQDGARLLQVERLVVAAGAQERHRPVPGWTLPGVVGLAGATNLLKAQGLLPGRRVVVAGAGPLLLLVAAGILKAGGEIAALVDARGRADWLRQMPTLAGRPGLMLRGAGWQARLLRARVPMLHHNLLTRINGDTEVTGVEVARIGGSAARTFDCDAVCYGFGLMPATEITRLLGLPHRFDADRGGWTPETGPDGVTAIPNLYLCGDGSGVLGADVARMRGRLTGAAITRAARGNNAAAPAHSDQRAARRAARFGQAMTRIATPPAETLDNITPETIVCRCEGLSRADLDTAIAAGAVSMNALKSATRCCMGPCGGRICGDTAATLIEVITGRSAQEIGAGTVRPPLRPVTLGDLAGDFNYSDLTMPEPAPQ